MNESKKLQAFLSLQLGSLAAKQYTKSSQYKMAGSLGLYSKDRRFTW